MKEKISIIIPAFNEETAIAGVIKDIKENLIGSKYEYEIIVVDDASRDQTAKIARKEGAEVIIHPQNKGYGATIKTGIKSSDGEFIAIIDADGSYAGKDLSNLAGRIQDNDMVIGARTKPGVKESLLRKIDKSFLTLLASYLVETRIPDLNSGLRIIRKDRLKEFFKILPNRFSFTATATIAFLNSNLRVSFVPIDYKKRQGKSKIKPIHDTLNFIQLTIKTVMYFNPLKVFIPASLFLFIAGIVVFLYSYFFMAQVMDITTVVLILSSIQILAIGMIADLIIKRIS